METTTELVMGDPQLTSPILYHYTDYYTFGKLDVYQIKEDLAVVVNQSGNIVGVGYDEELAKVDAWARMLLFIEQHAPRCTEWHYEFT